MEDLIDDATDLEEKKKPSYISKDGFVPSKVYRGFTEISTLFTLVREYGGLICGGYVRYMCSTSKSVERAGDVDVYFPDEDSFTKFRELMEKKYNVSVVHENTMAVTFKKVDDPESPLFQTPVIQIIKPVKEGKIVATGSLMDILENFDFTVVRCGLVTAESALVDADFEHDEPRRILRLKNIHCPVSSTLRCMKYSRKGYWLPPMQAVRLFLDWDNRDLDWKTKLFTFLKAAETGEGLTQKDIDELEAMMRVD